VRSAFRSRSQVGNFGATNYVYIPDPFALARRAQSHLLSRASAPLLKYIFCESPKSSHQKPAQTELLMSVCPDLRNRHHQLVGSRRGARVAVTKTTIYIFCCPYSRLTEKKTVLCAVNRLLLTPWEVVTGRWPLRQTSDMYFWICGPV
jgi:hypothetical protein